MGETMANLSNQPYKGTRDYFPEDKRLQNYIFDTWRSVVESFGYEEYGAPTLEPLELYAAKSGNELVNEETYRFTDRGGREVAIRPEMTPTVARMIAARQQETPMPARWYSIANFMRYQRPQKGREREFWQLNLDLFGVDDMWADAEIIMISDCIMKALGAKPKMYTIKINHRRLIDFMMRDYLELDVVGAQLMMSLFDKKDKMEPAEFRDKITDVFEADKQAEGLQKIIKLFAATSINDLPQQIRDNPLFSELSALFESLRQQGVTSTLFDISLMRGLDYYNGMVFEVFDNHPDNNRSMFGGGRYDGLTTIFGADMLPVVGTAPGSTTTEDFLRAHELLPQPASTTELYLIGLGENVNNDVLQLAAELRDEEVRVAVDLTKRKLDKQIKAAVKKHIPYAMFVGENELKNKEYNLKNLSTGTEQTLALERIVSIVKDKRSLHET